MACLNMSSNEGANVCAAARISFSNDFADSYHQHPMMSYKEAPVSSDTFEFSVPGYNMISADQVFSKGKLMPLSTKTTTTLRDELLSNNDNDDEYAGRGPRLPKGMMMTSRRWRERLGFINIFPARKPDKNNLERIDETKVVAAHHLMN